MPTPASAPARTDPVDRPLEQQALIDARSLVDRMRVLYRELEQVTGAPVQMHRALAQIHREPGLHASVLADKLGITRPAMSQLLRGLSTRGWIDRRRAAEDQRAVCLYLTPAGSRILAATSGRASGTLQRALRLLPDEDLAGLARGLAALLPHLPEAAPAAVRAARRPGPTGTRRRVAGQDDSNRDP